MLLLIANPRFRLVWASFTLTAISQFLYLMVNGWLTLTITDSPFWVGAVTGVGGLGSMALTLPAGVLADRVSRRKLIAGASMASAAAASLMASVLFFDEVRLWHLVGVAAAIGVAGGLRAPAQLAIVADVVGRERLLSANAANFAGVGVAGVLAPLMGAAVVDAFDFAWAYVAVAVVGGVGALAIVALGERRAVAPGEETGAGRARRRESAWTSLKRGTGYVFGTANVRALIVMAMVGESFGWAHQSMLGVMARDVLGVGVRGLGYLQAAGFAGMLFSAVTVSNMHDVRRKGMALVIGSAVFGLLILTFAAHRDYTLALVVLCLANAAGAVYDTFLSTLIQSTVPSEMRGRVVSFQAFTWDLSAVSGFHTGAIASLLGAPAAIAIGAVVFIGYILRMVPLIPRLEPRRQDPPSEAA